MKIERTMHITVKNYKILKKIMHREISSFQDFGMSKKQFTYCIDKINEYIASSDLPSIKLDGDKLIIPKELFDNKERLIDETKDIYFDSENRISACELLIESSYETIYLNDLMSYFDVSKNTAYNDIKELGARLRENGLDIEFSRKDGYQVVGDELQIRKRINSLLYKLGEELMLEDILPVEQEDLNRSIEVIEEVEKELELQFVESRVKYMPYHIAIIIQRIRCGHILNTNELFFNELNDTFEFDKISKLIKEVYKLDHTEEYYLTLLLLSTSVSKFRIVNFERKNQLSKVIENIIDDFEKTACIKFADKEVLHSNILQHMIAAYYRVRYDLTLNQDMIDVIEANAKNNEFKLIESLVSKCIEPMNEFLEQEMPEIEKKFLVLQFAAWIRRQDLMPLDKPRAIVVCPNGVTISNLMFMSLREILPELSFIDVVSQRDFKLIDENTYDVVFSSVELECRKKLFIVKNIIEFNDKPKIRERVLGELYGHDVPTTDLGVVYRTIDSYLSQEQAEDLKKQISKELEASRKDIETKTLKSGDLNLIELITPERINIVNSVKDYKEAIRMAFNPLLKDGIVTENYVSKIINGYDFRYPNFLFGQKMAVPHASAKDGSNGLAMSLLKINNGVQFSEDSLVKVVVALAPTDTSSHLGALVQLSNLAMNEKDMDYLSDLTNRKDIQKLIEKYSNTEGVIEND